MYVKLSLKFLKRVIVVFESTVYPGATEEICAPELEKNKLSLKSGVDFFLVILLRELIQEIKFTQ